MNDLILHPIVDRQIQDVIKNPTSAVILIGPDGSGKRTLSKHIVTQTIPLNFDVDLDPSIMIVDATVNGGIDSSRAILEFTKLTTTGESTFRRAVIIENSDFLTPEAQNALLKTLEEPPVDTIFILTARQSSALLPTIISRTKQVSLRPPSLDQAKDYFSAKSADDEQIERAYIMSRGSMGLMKSLLEDDSHELVVNIDHAKKILASSVFERLKMIEEIAKDKVKISQTIESLLNVTRAALHVSLKKGNKAQIKSWYKLVNTLNTALGDLAFNPNAKLLLTDLFIKL